MDDMDCLGLKIISNVENHFKNDSEIDEYDILPVLTSEQNRNPVQLIEHKLGIESWGAKLMCCTAARELNVWLKTGKKSLNSEKDWLLSRTMCILLIVPDHSSAWNIRKDLVKRQLLNITDDLRLTRLILAKHPKSSEAFFQRRWLLSNLFPLKPCSGRSLHRQNTSEHSNQTAPETSSPVDSSTRLAAHDALTQKQISNDNIDHSDRRHDLVLQELTLCHQVADRYRNNYNAWTHRIWVNQHLSCCCSQVINQELEVTKKFVCCHISDHSGFQYRQFLIASLAACGEDVSETLRNELLLTADLISTYPGHEAIWYHRRFILHYSLHLGNFLSKELSSVPTDTKDGTNSDNQFHVPKRTRLESIEHGSFLESESEWCARLLEGFKIDSWQQTLVNHHLHWMNSNMTKAN